MTYDVGLFRVASAKPRRLPLPIAAAAYRQHPVAAGAGYGCQDDSAVVEVYERLVGTEVEGHGRKD